MLTIRLDIERIDYEKSVENLLPKLQEQIRKKAAPSDWERLVLLLQKDAAPIAGKLLQFMSVAEKDALIVWLVSSHQARYAAVATEHAAEILGKNTVKIGAFQAKDLPGTRMELQARQVEIDYQALLRSPVLGDGIASGAARLALQVMSPAAMEKQGMAMLNSELVKPKLLSTLSDGLRKAGLVVTLRDLEFRTETDTVHAGTETETAVPESIRTAVIKAVAAWMRDTL